MRNALTVDRPLPTSLSPKGDLSTNEHESTRRDMEPITGREQITAPRSTWRGGTLPRREIVSIYVHFFVDAQTMKALQTLHPSRQIVGVVAKGMVPFWGLGTFAISLGDITCSFLVVAPRALSRRVRGFWQRPSSKPWNRVNCSRPSSRRSWWGNTCSITTVPWMGTTPRPIAWTTTPFSRTSGPFAPARLRPTPTSRLTSKASTA